VKDEDLEYFASLKNDMRTQAAGRKDPPRFTATFMKERHEKALGSPMKGLWSKL
jgi:hypothetical protein